MSEEQSEKIKRKLWNGNFAAWKLDLIFAIATDKALKPDAAQIAIVLIRHLNSQTLQMFPSQDRLALWTGKTVRSVQLSLAKLVERGWIKIKRNGKQQFNDYAFDEQFVADAIGRTKEREQQIKQELRARREDRAEGRTVASDAKNSSHQVTRKTLRTVMRKTLRPNTEIEHSAEGKTDVA